MAELPDWVQPPGEQDPGRRAYFEVLKPGVATKEKVGLGAKAAVVFGRNPETTDVLLEHPSISRRHAAVVHDGKGGLFLYDFGSTHGTSLDGRRVAGREAVPLREGSRVKFAESSRTYLLRLPAAHPAAAEAEVVLDKAALEQLPMAFGSSKKDGNSGGALTKDAMAAGIAEMMKEIEAAEKRREAQEQEKGQAPAAEDGSSSTSSDDEEEDDGYGPPQPKQAAASSNGNGKGSASSSSMGPPAPPPRQHKPSAAAPPPTQQQGNEDEDDEAEGAVGGSSAEATARRFEVPMSHEVSLRGHHKSVTCVALDPSGARVAVGGMDYKMLLYDFGGMDRTHRAFRDIEPEDGNPVVAVSFSGTGDRLIVATGSSQPKIYDRDGLPQLVFVKGDPYIADMAQTKGHTMAVMAAQWHPSERDTVMTASLDGTVRLWDLNGPRAFDKLTCKRVIKARSQRNTPVPVTCAALSPAADYVAAGAQDGSVQVFSLRKTSWIKPDILMRPGHGPHAHVTSVAWAPDGKTLASRGTDHTIRLWDVRSKQQPLKPLKVLEGVDTFYDSANVCFSPDGKLLCAGTNIDPRAEAATGTLKFWEVAGASTEPVLTMGVAPQASVTHVLWHRRLKQIVCGTSAGGTKVLYDPAFSVKGALMSANRVKRAPDPVDTGSGGVAAVGKIINPGALPMYREDDWSAGKRKRKDRLDPVKSRKPEMPMNGPGFQGRLSGQSNFTQYVMQHKTKNTLLEEDPREAILKYAEKAKEGVQLVGRAYAKTAPVTPFLEKTLEQEQEDMEKMEQEILKK